MFWHIEQEDDSMLLYEQHDDSINILIRGFDRWYSKYNRWSLKSHQFQRLKVLGLSAVTFGLS